MPRPPQPVLLPWLQPGGLDRDASAELLTVRAVRTDIAVESAAARLLKDAGWLAVFQTAAEPLDFGHFREIEVVNLRVERPSYLNVLARVPRGTNH